MLTSVASLTEHAGKPPQCTANTRMGFCGPRYYSRLGSGIQSAFFSVQSMLAFHREFAIFSTVASLSLPTSRHKPTRLACLYYYDFSFFYNLITTPEIDFIAKVRTVLLRFRIHQEDAHAH